MTSEFGILNHVYAVTFTYVVVLISQRWHSYHIVGYYTTLDNQPGVLQFNVVENLGKLTFLFLEWYQRSVYAWKLTHYSLNCRHNIFWFLTWYVKEFYWFSFVISNIQLRWLSGCTPQDSKWNGGLSYDPSLPWNIHVANSTKCLLIFI